MSHADGDGAVAGLGSMRMRIPSCSECKTRMQAGFTVSSHSNQFRPEYWVEGPPEMSLLGIPKTKNKKMFDVVAYRCQDCGAVKFVAATEHR